MFRLEVAAGRILAAIPLVDGGTYSFDRFYWYSWTQLSEAAGKHIVFQRTGNPRFSDQLYKEMRPPSLVKEDLRREREWDRDFPTLEAEERQRIDECLKWIKRFGLTSEDLPCFVFVTKEGGRVGLLRMNHRWYESESSWRVFVRCFCAWLGQEDVVKLATGHLENAEISEQLSLMLQKLSQTVDRQLRSVGVKVTKPQRPVDPFPTPAGATWSDVEIKFCDGHTVSIRVKTIRQRCNYTRMGMDDGRSSNPTVQWKLLRAFAEGHGILDWTSSAAGKKNQKRRETLSSNLKAFFRISDDPFRLTDDGKGWKARFFISPEG